MLLVKMKIDEERIRTLTKYVSTCGRINKIESDHNLIFCEFNLSYQKRKSENNNRSTIFNFKNPACLEMYHEATSQCDDLFDLSTSNIPLSEKSDLFLQKLNKILHKTFTKSRIGNSKSRICQADQLMKLKSTLKVQLRNVRNDGMKKFISLKIEFIENMISLESSEENVNKVNEYIRSIETESGGFSQLGMWKLKSKLCPRSHDPPTAKLDRNGKLVTNPQKLLDLYVETYSDRLSHKRIKAEYKDIFLLKNHLWQLRAEQCSGVKTEQWTRKDLNTVLKSLKNNKSRGPLGMVSEIFKPGVIGEKLELSILALMNSIKNEKVAPNFMRLADISSIYKRKGSKKDLENDRGIFLLGILRKILDKLLYVDLYPELEEKISNSNIGALRKKNICNHLFVVYGIINAVINGEAPCMDIQIFDLIKCFDVLWVEDVMNDLYEALSNSGCNEKLALLYNLSLENHVSVKTAVGQTRRVNMPKIVMQGGSWGPIQCSNSIDKIGKDCEENRDHLYLYKNLVQVPVLSMVDDMLAFANCGQESVALNTYINTHIELKKMKFHTPDSKGKTKCTLGAKIHCAQI